LTSDDVIDSGLPTDEGRVSIERGKCNLGKGSELEHFNYTNIKYNQKIAKK
jgi:hypothetical protein